MAITFDSKIKELEEKKSELDSSILASQKQEYEERIRSLLMKQPIKEGSEKETLDEVRDCYTKMQEVDEKIKQIPENAEETIKEINEKIARYQKERERTRNIQLYKDTEAGIADIFGSDIIEYAKETNNEELINKLRSRKLSEEECRLYFEQDYRKHDEDQNMYEELFNSDEKAGEGVDKEEIAKVVTEQPKAEEKKPAVELPEGMSERIREQIKECEEFKSLQAKDIESFLRKELKNNKGEISDRHIKNKFKDNYKTVLDFIKYLASKYPEFKVTEELHEKVASQKTSGPKKHDKLVQEAKQSKPLETEDDGVRKTRLEKLNRISKMEDLEERCRQYVDLWEESGGSFSNKEEFTKILEDVIRTQTHVQFEGLFKNLLKKIIQTDLKPVLKPGHKTGEEYYSYALGVGATARRILIYPNGEIFNILRHKEYQKAISKRPPLDKRRKS